MSAGLAIFFRSLSTLFGCGMPLHRGLEVLGQNSEDPALARVSASLARSISSGTPLSVSMARHPDTFSELHVHLIKVGEETGALQHILEMLSTHEEKRSGLTQKLKSELAYPAILFLFACLVLLLGPPFLFRGLLELSAALGVDPPFITRMLLFLSDALRSPSFVICALGVVGGLVGFTRHQLRQKDKLAIVTEFALEIPTLGRSLRTLAISRFARCLSLQLSTQLNPLTSLRLAAGASGNVVLEKRMESAVRALEEGSTLTESLATTGFFPPAFLQFLRAGEETGTAPELAGRAADLYELEVEAAVSALVQLLEPLMMLGMGLLIGFVILGTMLPLVEAIKAF